MPDIGYVKHGNADVEKYRLDFVNALYDNPCAAVSFNRVFVEEWGKDSAKEYISERLYEDEILERVSKQFDWSGDSNGKEPNWDILVQRFCVQVYPAIRRRYYLKALHEAGMDLALYGSGWEDDPLFSQYAQGPIERADLNGIYQSCKINLHIHPFSTTHQRVNECALAGGFMLIAYQDPEKDWERVTNYYDKWTEFAFFDTVEDLVRICKYWLDPELDYLRECYAHNFQQTALNSQTCQAAAEKVIAKWETMVT